ncbi:MAG: hypothetical protein J3R72DRAFT_450441 [Linnemannia gamsii]|nr:MAG: hypothetical protein J3R72DRAFT_450441 [Linnemannia gamsii]
MSTRLLGNVGSVSWVIPLADTVPISTGRPPIATSNTTSGSAAIRRGSKVWKSAPLKNGTTLDWCLTCRASSNKVRMSSQKTIRFCEPGSVYTST